MGLAGVTNVSDIGQQFMCKVKADGFLESKVKQVRHMVKTSSVQMTYLHGWRALQVACVSFTDTIHYSLLVSGSPFVPCEDLLLHGERCRGARAF